LQNLVIADNVAYHFKTTLCLENLGVYGGIWHPKGIVIVTLHVSKVGQSKEKGKTK